MSQLSELLTYHAANPIGSILQTYRNNYDTQSPLIALSDFYNDLDQYLRRIEGNHNIYKIRKSFHFASFSIQELDIDISHFEELHSAIMLEADEKKVLTLSISILEEIAKGPPSMAVFKSPTSFLKSPAEASGFNVTAPILENIIMADLDKNVFTDVPGFWESFFEGKGWSELTSRIWESYQIYEKAENKVRLTELSKCDTSIDKHNLNKTHKAKKEKILEVQMNEREVWDWLNFFSEAFLDQLTGPSPDQSQEFPTSIEDPFLRIRRKYFRTDKTGRALESSGTAQIDFLIKSIGLPYDGTDDWENIDVLGEFTISPQDVRKDKFMQLSRCVREVFCAQPLRRFLHCFCLFKEQYELWLFDRSGAYSSGLKHIVDNKDMFIRALCSFLLMSDEEIGRDISILRDGESKLVRFPKIGDAPGNSFEIKSKPMVQPQRMVTRGTTCYESKDGSKVIKYSWCCSDKNPEVEFLMKARSVPGVVNLIQSEEIYATNKHLVKLDLSRAKLWDLKSDDKFLSIGIDVEGKVAKVTERKRWLTRMLITPRGRDVYSSGSIFEFVAGFRDAIKGHQGLAGIEILHGDISEGNIILLEPKSENDNYGMLIDLDHSTKMKGCAALEEDTFLTGTMKFMARERLEAAIEKISIVRTCRHDLESFFYVFIVGCIEYEIMPLAKTKDLNEWCTKNVKSNFSHKTVDIMLFDKLLLNKFTTSFEGLKELAEKLRKILFHDDGKYIETPVDCAPLYKQMIMALDETMEDITAGKIEDKIFKARRK